jgi:hypothetical protein
VQVITHHRKTQNIHRKDACQHFQPLTDPFPAMRVVLPRPTILSAQMRPSHTAIDDMEYLNFSVSNNLSPIDPWHTAGSARMRVEIETLILKSSGSRVKGAWHRDTTNAY